MWDLKIKGTSERLIYGSQRGEGAGGISWEAGTDIHTLQLLPPRRSVVSDPVRPHRWQPTRLLRPWGSPGKNTGVDCHALLRGIFPTQGSNPGPLQLLHGQAGSLAREPAGSPSINTGRSKYKVCHEVTSARRLSASPLCVRQVNQEQCRRHIRLFSPSFLPPLQAPFPLSAFSCRPI